MNLNNEEIRILSVLHCWHVVDGVKYSDDFCHADYNPGALRRQAWACGSLRRKGLIERIERSQTSAMSHFGKRSSWILTEEGKDFIKWVSNNEHK